MKPINRPLPTGGNGPVRTLMLNGKWMVPPSQRPKVPPPPEERTASQIRVDKMVSPLNHLDAEGKGQGRLSRRFPRKHTL